MQSNEQAETKKRKGAPKDDSKKLKKPKTSKEEGLTLNAAVKCVEILHSKVIHFSKNNHMSDFVFKGTDFLSVNILIYKCVLAFPRT